MVYLANITHFLIVTNKRVVFYIKPEYIPQVREFIIDTTAIINEPIIRLAPLADAPKYALDTWIGNSYHLLNRRQFLTFLTAHTNRLASVLQLPKIPTFSYNDPDLVARYNKLNPAKYHNVDILIINSHPQSNQYNYNEEEWKPHIRDLHTKYKIVTTLKVDDITCTMDDALTIKDIAAISGHVKYIIAINTGPLVGCFNKMAFENVKRWYIFVIQYTFNNTPNFKTVLNFDEIRNDLLA